MCEKKKMVKEIFVKPCVGGGYVLGVAYSDYTGALKEFAFSSIPEVCGCLDTILKDNYDSKRD